MSAAGGESPYDVVIVGGGAAGVGVGVALKTAGIENFLILERHMVGASFAGWPSETRFITPSFTTNAIGMLDLNAVAIDTSPAFTLQVEHPTGQEYAIYLGAVAIHFELPVRDGTNVQSIVKRGELFQVETDAEMLEAKHVIWAAGEFQYPSTNGFIGSQFCRHTATIPSYEELEGDEFVVVGGYESGVDVAYHLSRRGKRVRLFDVGCPWEDESSDPSIALSTYSLERMREQTFGEKVELMPNTPVVAVSRDGDGYEVVALNGRSYKTSTAPLYAGGFDGSHQLVRNLFAQRGDGYPVLSEQDESTIVPGIFLCGAAVRHEHHVFCFIYKYRQRFAVVAKAIATSLGLPAEELEAYRTWGMYLDDLSCCGSECLC